MEDTIKAISSGVDIDGHMIYAKKIKPDKFEGQFYLDIFLRLDLIEEHLLYVKVYFGQKPHYRPWVELFGMNHRIALKSDIYYFDSGFEDAILQLFSEPIGPGGKIYVEYYKDKETAHGLTYGFPPPITRLGHKLFNLDFTWYKDWYFPEGGHEGGQKLQGEKPLNKEARNRHLRSIQKETLSFLERFENRKDIGDEERDRYLLKALERSDDILTQIGPYLD